MMNLIITLLMCASTSTMNQLYLEKNDESRSPVDYEYKMHIICIHTSGNFSRVTLDFLDMWAQMINLTIVLQRLKECCCTVTNYVMGRNAKIDIHQLH